MTILDTIPALDDMPWEPAPHGYDQTGILYHTMIADLGNGCTFIISYDENWMHSSIAAIYTDQWGDHTYDTFHTTDWPAFDKLFGRDEWQAFVADHERNAIDELAAWDELEDTKEDD